MLLMLLRRTAKKFRYSFAETAKKSGGQRTDD